MGNRTSATFFYVRGGSAALCGGVVRGFLGDAPVVGLESDRSLLS